MTAINKTRNFHLGLWEGENKSILEAHTFNRMEIKMKKDLWNDAWNEVGQDDALTMLTDDERDVVSGGFVSLMPLLKVGPCRPKLPTTIAQYISAQMLKQKFLEAIRSKLTGNV